MEDRSLLLESSLIFDNNTLIDRIRQSLIDLILDPPTTEDGIIEVQNLVKESLQYLDKDASTDIIADLLSLISKSFSQCPSDLLPIFAEFFPTARSSPNRIILTANLLQILTSVNPPLNLPDYHSFVEEALQDLKTQLANNQTSFTIFNHPIPDTFKLRTFVNLLVLTNQLETFLSSFLPILLNPLKESFIQKNCTRLLKRILQIDMLSTIPSKFYDSDHFLSSLSPDELIHLIKTVPPEVFPSLTVKLENLCIRINNKDLTLSFLTRCRELNVQPKRKVRLLETISASDISEELWKQLETWTDFVLPEGIASTMTEFPNPVFALRTFPNPYNLPKEVFNKALLEANDISDYSRLFIENIPQEPIFESREFWDHVLSLNKKTSDSFKYGKSFYRLIQNLEPPKLIQLIDDMVMKVYPPSPNVCLFIVGFLSLFSDPLKEAYSAKEHCIKLVKDLKSIPCMEFWSLFPNIQVFVSIIQEQPTPFLLLGYFNIIYHTNLKIQLEKLTVMPQTKDDIKLLLKHRDIPSYRKIDFNENSLSLFASAILFTLSLFRHKFITVEGLTKETIIPFTVIVYQFAHSIQLPITTEPRCIKPFFEQNKTLFEEAFNDLKNAANDQEYYTTLFSHNGFRLAAHSAYFLEKMLDLMFSVNTEFINSSFIPIILTVSNVPNKDTQPIFSKYGMKLFECIYMNRQLLIGEERKAKLNLQLFDKTAVALFITQHIEQLEGDDLISAIKFFFGMCQSQPKFQIASADKFIPILHDLVDQQNWTDFDIFYRFLDFCDQKKVLVDFIDSPIPYSVKIKLLEIIPIDKITVDNLASVLVSSEKIEDIRLYNILINKMLTDKTIIHDHLLALFERIHHRLCITAKLILDLFNSEFKSYPQIFLKAVDDMFVKPPGEQTLLLRPDFQTITQPISPLGLEMINKLLDSQKEKPNYQSYYYLQCMAQYFLFLFTENPQAIFETTFKSLELFHMLLEVPKSLERYLYPLDKIFLNGETEQTNGENDQTNNETDQTNNETEQPNGETEQPNGENDQPNGETEQPNGENEQPNGENEQPNGDNLQENPIQENHAKEEQAKIASSAIVFLQTILFSPIVLDAFLNWSFENINRFDDSQILAFLLILRSLSSIPTAEIIVTSFLIKNNFPEIITQLLQRPIKDGLFKDTYLLSIYRLAASYYRALNALTPESFAIIDELQKLDNPAQVTYDHCIKIHSPEGCFASPLQLLELNMPSRPCILKDLNNFISILEENKVRIRALDVPKSILDDFLIKFSTIATIPKKYEGPLPQSVKLEPFQALPMKLQSTALHLSLPIVTKPFSSSVYRYLVRQPAWVSMWLQKNYQLLLLPEHYAILLEVMNHIVQIQQSGESNDDALLEELLLVNNCQGDLFEELINIACSSSSSNASTSSLFSVFAEIAKDDTALISLLQYVSNRFESFSQDSNNSNEQSAPTVLYKLFHLLLIMSKVDGFKDNFPDICSDSVLTVVCSYKCRDHSSILIPCSKLFATLGDAIPNRTEHLICFMLMSKKKKVISAALDLCAKLSPSAREDIMRYVEQAFDHAISSYTPLSGSAGIDDFLKRFPIIAKTRQNELIDLLKKLLPNFNQRSSNEIELVGSLFQALAPKRGQSQSVKLSDTVDGGRPALIKPIPSTLYSQAPAFWDIFQEYNKIINDIIRNDLEKLNTTFSFLLGYPELLDFSIRVLYFQKQMKSKIRPMGGSFELTVRRSHILDDSYNKIFGKNPQELLKPIHVKFINEEGVDAGGLKRDWFTSLVKELFNPNYALFIPSSNKRSSQPNPLSFINNNHIAYFKFAGQLIARALIEGINVDAHLTTSFCKHILRSPLSLRDLEDVDESLHKSLQWILANNIDDPDYDPELYFIINEERLGSVISINLIPNGDNVKVTNDNKEEYINLIIEHRLKNSIAPQLKSFCDGFYSLISYDDIKRFSPNELDLLICGIPNIDVEDLKKYTEYQFPYTADTPVIRYFFDAISKWDNEKLAKLLLFITGSSQLPIAGFKTFKDSGNPITIAPGGGKERLPAAHTCFNRIDLPEYDNEEDLNRKLMFAIQECNTFGFI